MYYIANFRNLFKQIGKFILGHFIDLKIKKKKIHKTCRWCKIVMSPALRYIPWATFYFSFPSSKLHRIACYVMILLRYVRYVN